MKWSHRVLTSALIVASASLTDNNGGVSAFAVPVRVGPLRPVVAASSLTVSSVVFAPRRSKAVAVATVSSLLSSSALSMSSSPPSLSYTVGIVGATGAVGKEIRTCLEARVAEFPVRQLRIFGSARSAGSRVESETFGSVAVELFDVAAARECDVVFLAVSGEFSLEHARALSDGPDGCVVIDNSSAFRYEPDVPLIVPEINGAAATKECKLIANPNCTTAIGLMALWPLHKAFTLKKIIMSTYQAASGAGQPGMDELLQGTRNYLDGERVTNEIFAHPLPFNVIPQIDKFMENGYTKEEMKVVWESRKICGLADDFPVSCTAVRIPTIRAHSESIVIETEKPVDIATARAVLAAQDGLKLVDDTAQLQYPMPSTCTGQFDVEVGRVRKSLIFGDYGLEFFVCGDQLLRGAALNAVLVAEVMASNGALNAKGGVATSP